MVYLDLGNLVIHLRADTSQYDKAMMKVVARMQAMSAKMIALGRSMVFGITLPLAIIGTLSTIAFAKFDDAMTKSLAIMGDVSDGMRKKMTDLALSLSEQGVTSAKDLAKSYFFLASAGLTAEQSMASLATVEAFAVAGAFDMATATDLLTDAQSALGMRMDDPIKNMENMLRLSNLLTGANTLANASTQQFSEALTTQAAAAMKAFNIPVEEGLAILAAFADQGIKAQRAGTMFSRMIRLSTRGILSHQRAWSKLGVAFFDIEGRVLPMAKIFTLLSKKLDNLQPKQKAVALGMLGFQARSLQTILPLLGLGKRIGEYTEKLDRMGEVTEEVAEKMRKSFSAQMKRMWNQIVGVSISIGKMLAPSILRMNDLISRATIWWKGLTDQTKKWILVASVGFAVTGPIILGMGVMIGALGKIYLLLRKISLVVLLINSRWLVAIAAIAAGLYVLRTIWKSNWLGMMKDFQKGLPLIVKDIKKLPALFVSIGKSFLSLGKDVLGRLKSIWGGFFDFLRDSWLGILRIPGRFVDVVKDAFKRGMGPIAVFGRLFVKMLGMNLKVARSVVDGFFTIVRSYFVVFKKVVGVFFGWYTKAWSFVFTIVRSYFVAFRDFFGWIFKGLISIGKQFFKWNADAWRRGFAFVLYIFDPFVKVFDSVYDAIASKVKSFLEWYKGAWSKTNMSIGTEFKNFFANLVGTYFAGKALLKGGDRAKFGEIMAAEFLKGVEKGQEILDKGWKGIRDFDFNIEGFKAGLEVAMGKLSLLWGNLKTQIGEDYRNTVKEINDILSGLFPKKEQLSADMDETILAGPVKQLSIAERRVEAFKNKIVENMKRMRDAVSGKFQKGKEQQKGFYDEYDPLYTSLGRPDAAEIILKREMDKLIRVRERAMKRIEMIEQRHFQSLDRMRKRLGVVQDKGPIPDFGTNASEVADLMQGGKFKKFELVRTSLVDPRSQDTSLININRRIMDINTRILSESEKQTEGIRELVDNQTE